MQVSFTNLNREIFVSKMKTVHFDLLVIGGGITGSGISLDAVTRGMTTALVDMQDFSAGTSSRSTKLVHGGLRYLKQLEVRMVAEVGKERAIVYENGPHVTRPEWMLLPFHEGGTFGKYATSIGLLIYDFLASVPKNERRVMLNPQETLQKEPLLKKDGLKGGGYYVEYRTDDARLTIEVLKEAVDKGTVALNYTKVEKFLYKEGKVVGVSVLDQLTGQQYQINAKQVVNATGPWVDHLREQDNSKNGKTLRLSKGVHIVINQSRFPLKQSIYFDTPDGRMVFAIPRNGKTYVGTTDTFFDQNPASPTITNADRTYLIQAINYMFPSAEITEKDIESSWVGIRPLIHEDGKGPSEISRKDEIWESQSGLVSIAGGKLTGYRKMAESTVDFIAKKFEKMENCQFRGCQTKLMPISGGHVGGSKQFAHYVNQKIEVGVNLGLTMEESMKLTSLYGSNIEKVFSLFRKIKQEVEKYALPLPLHAMLDYAIQYEMVVTPVDFFYRRTGDLLFNIDYVREWKNEVVSYLAEVFTWSDQVLRKYEQDLINELEKAAYPEEANQI